MKPLFLAAAALLVAAPALAQTTIEFAPGSYSGSWSGYVYSTPRNGEPPATKRFRLNVSKGQWLRIDSEQIYEWKAIMPSGRVAACNGGSYCHGFDGNNTMYLSEGGPITIRTTYRLDSGATSPMLPRRYVNVVFTVR